MGELPKLYRPVLATFWSLRGAVGPYLGYEEVDELVERMVMRVRCPGGCKYVVCRDKFSHRDNLLEVDQECLDNCEW